VRWRKCVERQGDNVEKWYTCVPILFNKSHVKKYLRFSFDSPSYISAQHNFHQVWNLRQQIAHLRVKWT
jgi:hypothetical protein